MYSMKIYSLIMKSFDWEGMREELHQHFQEFNSYGGLGQPMGSFQESSQPALPLLERRGMLMHNSMCVKDYDGKEFDHDKQVVFPDLLHSFAMLL